MNILAVDTAGKTAGVALLQDDRLLYEVYLDGGMTHSETLMPMIDTCLKLCGLTCADIDLYAVNAGPGSFTGLRIGLAAVKGLAFPRETLCAPVSTLEALAAAHTGEGTVLCALDARRAQVYSAAFDLATHTRLLDDDARAVTDLADFVENCKKPLFFVGDGAGLCYNKYSNVPGVLEGAIPLSIGNAAIRSALGKLFSFKCMILIAVIVLSILFYRPFCKWICPLGAIYSLFNKVSLLKITVDSSKCVGCGQCSKACKMDVDVCKTPDHLECIRCGACIKACPKDAICYRFMGKSCQKNDNR